YYSVGFRSDNTGAVSLHQYADPTDQYGQLNRNDPLLASIPIGVWTRIVMTTTFAPGASHMTISIDGTAVVDQDIEAHKYKSSIYLRAGIFNTENTGKSVSILTDDLLVTAP